jgi:hypothetical protein
MARLFAFHAYEMIQGILSNLDVDRRHDFDDILQQFNRDN